MDSTLTRSKSGVSFTRCDILLRLTESLLAAADAEAVFDSAAPSFLAAAGLASSLAAAVRVAAALAIRALTENVVSIAYLVVCCSIVIGPDEAGAAASGENEIVKSISVQVTSAHTPRW